MPLQIKKTGTVWSSPATPFFKKTIGQAFVTPIKASLKTGVSTWTEVWPLVPGSASALGMNWLYRNDRIEVDFTWTAAPGTGTNASPVATTNYIVYVIINGSIYGGYNLGVATSMTLTDGDGFQDKAGQSARFIVQAQSAAGVLGPQVSSGTTTIPQLPAPPQVTSVAQALTYGDLSYSWAHVGGNRLTGFQVNISSSYGPATYFFGAATSVSTGAHPWSGASVNGGNYQVDIYPYGPGGYGPVYSFTGSIPNDVGFSNVRCSPGSYGQVGSLVGTLSVVGNATSAQVYWNQNGGGNNYIGNVGAGNSNVSQSAAPYTTGGLTDPSNYFRWVCVPLNAYGSGRITVSGFIRALTPGGFINATAGDTYIAGYGGFINNGLVEQGWDSAVNSDCYGYMFYGNQFRDLYSDANLGFHLNITYATVYIVRGPYGTPSPLVLAIGLHTAADRSGANNSFAGLQYCYPSISVGSSQVVQFPAVWVRYMIDQTNGWKGLGLYIHDTSQNQNGTVYASSGSSLQIAFSHDAATP